jgi:hypothetical protein
MFEYSAICAVCFGGLRDAMCVAWWLALCWVVRDIMTFTFHCVVFVGVHTRVCAGVPISAMWPMWYVRESVRGLPKGRSAGCSPWLEPRYLSHTAVVGSSSRMTALCVCVVVSLCRLALTRIRRCAPAIAHSARTGLHLI